MVNQYITLLVGYWLGGKDDITEGKWYWENSKKPFNYTDWYPGEPNDQGNNEDCLHLFFSRNEHWNDSLCGSKQHFICEARFVCYITGTNSFETHIDGVSVLAASVVDLELDLRSCQTKN